ncbi:hypothetical protein DFH08DRAFT_801763 [Mycena albidolilacea]|uniref:Uncharacterized protein n=1 Tax=Mycena albidolilacea TaxID=1033008 RepID=A0AAD7F0A0_9AGAR|nr:hypothetical protein DFH08DRAFT_801763 [Mycena albidolilacea]
MAATQWVAREKNGILATCATDFEGFWQGTQISSKNVTQLVPFPAELKFEIFRFHKYQLHIASPSSSSNSSSVLHLAKLESHGQLKFEELKILSLPPRVSDRKKNLQSKPHAFASALPGAISGSLLSCALRVARFPPDRLFLHVLGGATCLPPDSCSRGLSATLLTLWADGTLRAHATRLATMLVSRRVRPSTGERFHLPGWVSWKYCRTAEEFDSTAKPPAFTHHTPLVPRKMFWLFKLDELELELRTKSRAEFQTQVPSGTRVWLATPNLSSTGTSDGGRTEVRVELKLDVVGCFIRNSSLGLEHQT